MAKHALLWKLLLEVMYVPSHILLVKASHMLLLQPEAGWGCLISPEERQYIFVNSYTIHHSIKTVTFFKSDLGRNILKLRVRHFTHRKLYQNNGGKETNALRNIFVLYCKAISLEYGYGSTVILYCLSRFPPLNDSLCSLVSEFTSQPSSLSTAGQQCQNISVNEATGSCWSLSLCSDPVLFMSNEDK